MALIGSSAPFYARAQGLFVPVNVSLETAPTAVKRTADTTMLQVKGYVLDGLAWAIAKIMLQQVTVSVVNWINSGFEGSPAFLTNPGAFFADAADQVTGAFIANTGALSQLCSPFSVDIRLNLALTSQPYNITRYACTLNTVINNVKNSTVSVNGNVSMNGRNIASGGAGGSIAGGASMQGFMNGDFSQGGWPAFMAMTTQPQNNIYGAYLQAKSDLETQIANKQNSIRLDLTLGRGFMSWQKCKDVSVDEAQFAEDTGFNLAGPDYYSGASNSLTKKVDPKTGKTSYKNCETQTPGSVIAGSIDKSLGIPQDTLNIAGSLNQIIGALFAQLVSKVLSGGLAASSNYGYSGSATAGVATQLLQQQQGNQLAGSKDQLSASLNSYSAAASQYVELRKQAVDAFAAAKNAYQTAAACFAGKLPSQSSAYASVSGYDYKYAQNQIAAISAASNKVEAAMDQYQAKLSDAMARTAGIKDLQNEISSAQTTDQVMRASNDYNAAMQNGAGAAFISQADLANAQTDLAAAQTQAGTFVQNAQLYQNACNSFRPVTTYSGYNPYSQ